jgi:hypothetical protein
MAKPPTKAQLVEWRENWVHDHRPGMFWCAKPDCRNRMCQDAKEFYEWVLSALTQAEEKGVETE